MNPIQDYRQLSNEHKLVKTYQRGLHFYWLIPLIISIILFASTGINFFSIAFLIISIISLIDAFSKKGETVKKYDYDYVKCLNYDRNMCKDCRRNSICSHGWVYDPRD